MKKFVAGMIAVFFAQIGFQVFTTVERVNDEFASNGVASAPALNPARTPDVESIYAMSTVIPESTEAVTSHPVPTVIRRADKPRSKAAVDRQMTTAGAASPPRPSSPAEPEEIDKKPLSADVREKKPKRSFFAKIVKKPYDLLKAVASTFK